MRRQRVILFLLFVGYITAKKEDVDTEDQSPSPVCFIRHDFSSFAGQSPFKVIRENDSPRSCSAYCSKIHDDPDEDGRVCVAFEYNTRNGVCKLYDRNSSDENVRLVDNGKTRVYQVDEQCWANHTARPIHTACPIGTKPVMELVNGAYLKKTGLSFKQIPEKQCVKACLKDQTPIIHDNFKCLSISYNEANQDCIYMNHLARPLDKLGPALTPNSRYRFYSKLCLSPSAVAKCPGFITRFVGKQLVAMADANITTSTYSDCVSACLTADTKLGFDCRSGMFYNMLSTGNCILNFSDHYQERTLFIDDRAPQTDYFSIRSCNW